MYTYDIDQAYLAVIHKKRRCWLFASEGETALLREHEPSLCIPTVEVLSLELVQPLATITVLQYPTIMAEQYAEAVRIHLEAIGWYGELRLPRLPEGFRDLAALRADCTDDVHFLNFLVSLAEGPDTPRMVFEDPAVGMAEDGPEEGKRKPTHR
jgi:hypothetical protein